MAFAKSFENQFKIFPCILHHREMRLVGAISCQGVVAFIIGVVSFVVRVISFVACVIVIAFVM